MKYILALIVFCLCSGKNAFSQASDTFLLKKFEMPVSPAFILLDQAPTLMERPGSNRPFMLSILNSFRDNNGVPKNYAVTFTPFWFFRQAPMSSLEYAGYGSGRQNQDLWANLKKASFSAAFVSATNSLTGQPVNHVALGVHFNLISIRSQQDLDELTRASQELLSFLQNQEERLQHYLNDPALAAANPALYYIKVQAFQQQEAAARKRKEDQLSDILARKPRFGIDGSAGYHHRFADNSFTLGESGRTGAWLTLNYSNPLPGKAQGSSYLHLYGFGRYLSSDLQLTNDLNAGTDLYDLGGKLELETRFFSLAYEYIQRFDDRGNTFRSNGQVNYKVSDQVVLTGAFGRNFGEGSNLISLVGIHWGFSTGNEKVVLR